MRRLRPGFTLVEVMVIISVIAILAAISIVAYGDWRHNVDTNSVRNDVAEGANSLDSFKNFNSNYPPNLAGIGFIGSPDVSLALWTNAPGVPSYTGLTADQNAQLFLNSCNAYMPIVSGGTTYNTACSYAGINMHISGQQGSNLVLHGPSVNSSDFVLTCGSACITAQNSIIDIFRQQGGTWPIVVPKASAALPSATGFTTTGPATQYCIQGTSPEFSDIVYHKQSGGNLESGPCPDGLGLHYP